MDAGTIDYLASAPGRALLDEVSAAYDTVDPLHLSERLRAHYPAEQVAAAVTQVALRRAAVTKFGAQASGMFFTRDGLEQATHRIVANHRAARAAYGGATSVIDLGCGVGADLIAFAQCGVAAAGVEADATTAAVARANLAALGLDGRVTHETAEAADRGAYDLTFADPARRGKAGRVFDPGAYSPPWSFVEELLTGDAAVKTAPGIDHARVPVGVEAEWVSLDGQLREAALWSGRFAHVDRRATVLSSGGNPLQLTDDDDPGHAAVRNVGSFVYEPDDAVIRAHLVTAFAARVDGWLLDPHLAYVSSEVSDLSGLAKCYQVVDVLPFREKPLRAALRARGVGTITIKKRGVAITPEELRRRLKLTGKQAATIIITRTPGHAQVLLVDPL